MGYLHWEIPRFSTEEGQRRHRRVRDLMKLKGIDCLIIAGHTGNYRSAAADVRYISNFCPWFDDSYVVFPLEGEPILFVWSPGHGYWAKQVGWCAVRVSAMTREGRNYVEDVAGRIKELGLESVTLGLVSTRTMPAYMYIGLRERLPHANFASARDILLQCRAIKSAEEQEFLRKSAECADEGFKAMAALAKPGVTEYELVAECESAMIKAGAETGNFILLGSGPWSKRESAIPIGGSARKLKDGDIILNEITVSYGGYFTQLCRPISIGSPPDEFLELLEVHKGIYYLVLKELVPGNTVDKIEAKVKDFASRRGDFRRVWALQETELNEAAIPYRGEVKRGMAFVVHPWTVASSVRGHSGHIIGDTFIVREGEPEALSRLPLEVSVV